MKLHNGLVTVRVFDDSGASQTEIFPGDKHILGELNPGTVLILQFEIDESVAGGKVVPITTSRDKTVAKILRENQRDGRKVFEHSVLIRSDGSVDNNSNLVRLLTMTNKGLISSKNVAVIVQKGYYYVAPAETYRVQAYRDEKGKVVVPDLFDNEDGKGSFSCAKEFVLKHYGPQFALPPIASYKKPSLPDCSQLKGENDMIVLSWSLANNTGVGLRKDGNHIKLHASKVNVADREPVYLYEAEIITAEGFGPPPRGSSLQAEAFGITRTEEMAEV